VAALQWAGQLLCLLLKIRVPEAWIKNEGFIAPLRHVGSAAPGWASRCACTAESRTKTRSYPQAPSLACLKTHSTAPPAST
jgi:hypothetical protein